MLNGAPYTVVGVTPPGFRPSSGMFPIHTEMKRAHAETGWLSLFAGHRLARTAPSSSSLCRRALRIAPGGRLNLGLHGAGLSVGSRGLHVGVNRRGMYTS